MFDTAIKPLNLLPIELNYIKITQNLLLAYLEENNLKLTNQIVH